MGVLELNRNPENYFAEIEQAAFSPSNIVPGIGFSPDKVLQARIFSYAEAMQSVPQDIVGRQLAHFAQADPAYAQGVRKALEKMSADSGNLADVMTLSLDEQSARPAQPHATS